MLRAASKGSFFYLHPVMNLKTEGNPILQQVVRISREAGAFIRDQRNSFEQKHIVQKGLNDLVSYVDLECEKRLVENLRQVLPGCGFITEENTATQRADYNWIIDPLDGTTNFIHGIPCFAVSIALEHNSEIILGVVYEVNRDECFSAIAGGGAELNGKTISVSACSSLSESLIATGFPIYNFSKQDQYLAVLKELMKTTRGIRRIGSAASDLCYLACGRVDAFFEYNLNPWDVAAGALIVTEAGGNVSDFNGREDWLFGKEIVAANPNLFGTFQSLVAFHLSDKNQTF